MNEFIAKNKSTIITSALWIAIILFLVVFNTKKQDNYKESIKYLTQQKDSLKHSINAREQKIDSLVVAIDNSQQHFDTINFQDSILKKKLKKYEKSITDIRLMSIDDNILLLTKQLSEEDRTK